MTADGIQKIDLVVRTPKSWERVCEVCIRKASVAVVPARKTGE